MTVRRNTEWGTIAAPPADVVVLDDDRALGALLTVLRASGGALPPVALRRGDLARTLGGAPWASPALAALLPVDVVRVEAAGDARWTAAHVVARRGWWRGEIVAVMNAQFLGPWDVAPRSHPNDGRVDIVHVQPAMRARARWSARRRLPAGTHVPHPDITARQATASDARFARPLDVWVDGMRWRRADALRVTVEPDALVVCVPVRADTR